MTDRLPPPSRPALLEKHGSTGRTWLLNTGRRRVAVGVLSRGILTKRFDPSRHAWRTSPGVGVNLEVIQTCDQHAVPPRELVLLAGPNTARVPWDVVRAYAADVLKNGARSPYLIRADVDRQVLIPWSAFDGRDAGPAPPPAEPLSLFDPPKEHR